MKKIVIDTARSPLLAFIVSFIIWLIIFYLIKEDFFIYIATFFLAFELISMAIVWFAIKRFSKIAIASFIGLLLAALINAHLIGLIKLW